MSQLPVGTSALKAFLQSVIAKGIETAAIAWLPGIAGIPIIGALYIALVKWVVTKFLSDPLLDEGVSLGLALVYVIDRANFDKEFIKISMLDKQNATSEQIEEALQNAEAAMASFIRRGPIA